eukprot:TRINITY_DN8416_c0_g1_i1.p1 TRINITY_DN8416_c0_g1~~TRINITY_DN8416_c0_g1_i1.p1  ORF type:complete len:496 (+),score=141.40 TRINITY_DN8416_c0_g1_i1:128-1489(+)
MGPGMFLESPLKTMSSNICGICSGPFVSRVFVPGCGHTFCKRCIEGWQMVHSSCPCDPPLVKKLSASYLARNMVERLRVSCPARNMGCTWSGDNASFSRHRAECQLLRVPCPYGCGARDLTDDDLSVHMTACSCRPVQCDACDAELSYAALQSHQELECPETLTTCADCTVDVKRGAAAAHASVCPRGRSPCPHAGFGCAYIGTRQDVEVHLGACVYESLKGFIGLVTQNNRANQEKVAEYERLVEQQQKRLADQDRKAILQDQRIALLEAQVFELERSIARLLDSPLLSKLERQSLGDFKLTTQAPRHSWHWSNDDKNAGVTLTKGNSMAMASSKDVYQTVRANDPLNRDVKIQKFTIKVRAGKGYSWDYGVTNYKFDPRTAHLWNAPPSASLSYRFAVGPRPTVRMELDFDRMTVSFFENGDRKCERPLPNWNEYYPTLSMYNAGEVEIIE